MTHGRDRGTGAQRSIEEAEYERDLVPDPGYRSEIAMLERSIEQDQSILSLDGLQTVIERLAFLRRIGPFFDGKRMTGLPG